MMNGELAWTAMSTEEETSASARREEATVSFMLYLDMCVSSVRVKREYRPANVSAEKRRALARRSRGEEKSGVEKRQRKKEGGRKDANGKSFCHHGADLKLFFLCADDQMMQSPPEMVHWSPTRGL